MKYNMKLTLASAQRKILQSLKGEVLSAIYANRVGDYCLSVILCFKSKQVQISNKIVDMCDDEYPTFSIQYYSGDLSTFTLMGDDSGKSITGISFFRDTVSWHSPQHKWSAISDFAIVLYLGSKQIVIELADSLAGLMKLKFDEETLISQENYWQMKTDVLDSAYRTKNQISNGREPPEYFLR